MDIQPTIQPIIGNYFDKAIKWLSHQVHSDMQIGKNGKMTMNFIIENIIIKLLDTYKINKNLGETVKAITVGKLTNHALNDVKRFIQAKIDVKDPFPKAVKKFISIRFSLLPLDEEKYLYITGVVEYLIAEILELTGNTTRDNKRVRITPYYIYLAISRDEELQKVLDIWVRDCQVEVDKQFKLFTLKQFNCFYKLKNIQSIVINKALGINQPIT